MTTRQARMTVTRLAVAVVCLAPWAGCAKKTQPTALESQPAEEPKAASPVVTTKPTPVVEPVATRPAETRPAETQPASTYDSRPPYPVKLYVRRPEEEQPGWLRIMKLADEQQPATATGTFPEKNHIYVDSQNVQRLRIHIGHLPLAARQRIVLHIDDQPIQIARKRREFIMLERTPAGVWETLKSP